MATSLGRLVLDMAANSAGFERDMQRISKSAKKELTKVNRELWKAERDLERARGKVTRLATAMGAIGAAGIALAAREFRNLSREADRVQKLGIATGLTAEAVQELGFAAEQSGANMESLVKGVQQMQKNIVQAQDGLATYTRAFERVGISVKDLEGLTPEQQFLTLAQALSEVEDPTVRTATAMELLGRAGKDLIPLLNSGSAGIQELQEQMRSTGAVMSQETVDAAAKLNDALNVLTKQFDAVKVAMFSDLIGPLSEFAEWLANTEEGQRLFNESLAELGNTAKTLGAVIGGVLITRLVAATAAMVAAEIRVARLTAAQLGLRGATVTATTAVTVFGRAVSVMTGPIGIAIGVLGTLYMGYQSVKEAAETAGVSMDDFGRGAETTAERVARLTGNMEDLRKIEIKRNFDEMRQEAVGLRQEIIELDQEIAKIKEENQGAEFLDHSFIDLEAYREDLMQRYLALVDGANELNEAYKNVGQSSGRAGDEAEKSRKSFRDLGKEAETFATHLEDLSDRLAGDQAQALRSFTRQVQRATGLFQAGAIGIEAYAQALRLYHQELNQATAADQDGIFPDFGVLDTALDALEDMKAEMQEIAAIEWNFENIIDSFHPLAWMMRQLEDDMKGIDAALNKELISEAQAGMFKLGASANAAFSAMMSGVDRTSSEYKKLERAQQITNVALGIAAILQQGMGDPYTAIPRMIEMAAMVASLGVDAGGLGGGGAARRQEQQGTGTVLGDSAAKSESIANAVEMTADATSKLVGINRGMAQSLRRLQDGLTGAATMLAQRGDVDYGRMNLDLGTFNNISNDIWDPFGFFSSTKVKDEGIELLGGAIAEMTEGAVGLAFQTVKKSGLFGSSTKTGTADLGEALNDQMNLIFASMIDTVEAAGEALGIPLDEIQARIDAFEVESQKISLKGLDAEEQKAELEAVFSRIFDDLASSVIPFIDQFQKIGEGMGETLVRVATSVQVAQEAIKRLGLNISDSLGPERMAQVSVGLIEAAGGIESFITDMENFMSKFAPESHKFAVAQSDITRALDQMGTALPEGRQGFWELIQAIDGTTEAGQRQIATLLSLTDAADTYYSAVEEIEQERAGLQQRILQLEGDTAALREIELQSLDESNRALQERIWTLEREAELADLVADVNQQLLQEMSPAHANLARLMGAYSDLMAQARELGASEETLMNIRRLHSAQLNAMAATLRAGITDSIDSLFGSEGMASSMSSTASSISSSMGEIQASMIDAIKGVQDWLDRSLLGDNSPLLPQEQLDAAGSQFWDAIDAARGGDAEAAGNLPQLADQFLSQASGFWGTSTAEYQDIWQMVRDAMQGVADMDVAQDAGPPTYGQTANIEQATQATAQSAYEQMIQAQHLVGQIDALARITGDSPADIAEELGVPMGSLIEMIGEEPAKTAEALEQQFNDLVTGFGDTLNPLMNVEQAQLEELRNIVTLMGGEVSEATKPIDYTTPLPVDQTGSYLDGAYVVPVGGALIQESPGAIEQFTAMNERLQRIEDRLEDGNRYNERTAESTGQSVRQNNELVILQRQIANRRDVPRIRS